MAAARALPAATTHPTTRAREAPMQPCPPPTSRQDALGRLRIERWHAQQAGETARVAEIDAQIDRLSARSTPACPHRETTSAAAPRTERRTTRRTTDV